MGQLKEFNTLIHHNLSPNRDRERLQIVKLLLDPKHCCSFIDQIDVDFLQQLRQKAGLIETP